MADKIPRVGSKAMVYHGTARQTSGGLKKKDLLKIHGRIVSRKKHELGKKAIKRLFALGYKPKKGSFTVMRKSMVDGRRTRKHHRGRRHTRKQGGAAGIPLGVSGTGHPAGTVAK